MQKLYRSVKRKKPKWTYAISIGPIWMAKCQERDVNQYGKKLIPPNKNINPNYMFTKLNSRSIIE